MTYKIVAAIWFLGVPFWIAAAYFNARAGNGGLAVLNVACVALYAAAGVLYFLAAK